MFVLMISRSSLKLEHLGSKTRSPGQISVKSSYHTSGHIFQAVIMNLAQNVCLDEFYFKFETRQRCLVSCFTGASNWYWLTAGEGLLTLCRVSCFTGASNWYWLTAGEGLLTLQLLRVEGVVGRGEYFYFFCFFTFISFPLSPLFLSFISSTISSISSFSLGNDTKWPTRVDVSLNQDTINQKLHRGLSLPRKKVWG